MIDDRRVLVSGVVPLSTIDMPGRACMVVFVPGCGLRCPHCHNSSLQDGRSGKLTKMSDVDKMFRDAWDFIDGVVLSGGDPIYYQYNTIDILRAAKEIGLHTGIETSGYNHRSLRSIMQSGYLDEIYLDIKATLDYDGYKKATGDGFAFMEVMKSLELCFGRFMPFWLRTVIFDDILTPNPDMQLIKDLKATFPDNRFQEWIFTSGRTNNDKNKSVFNQELPKVRTAQSSA
jgi:pyruvate formate lyase activating enzyme